MKKIKVEYANVWMLAGVVEELRGRKVEIPEEAELILRKELLMVNVAPYVRSGRAGRNLSRLREILGSLDVPEDLPDSYGPKSSCDESVPGGGLPPLSSEYFLEDNILGVGLKSYPYVMDFDGDGRPDLLVGDHDGFIYVYLNEGTAGEPRFGRAERLRADDTGSPLIVTLNPKMTFGDLTGTGSLDLVLGTYGGKIPFIPNRAGKGGFSFSVKDVQFLRSEEGPIDGGYYVYPELVDWDGSGRPDLVTGTVEGDLLLFRNLGREGEAVFAPPEAIAGVDRMMYPHPVFVDWTGEGRKDLTLGHRDGTVVFYRNTGKGANPSFRRVGAARHEDGRPVNIGFLSHQFIADWNDDGVKDLILGNDPGQVTVFLNIGTNEEPVFDEGRILRDGGGELIMGVHPVFAMADLDGDGLSELIAGHQEERIRVFRNVGSKEEPRFDGYMHPPGVVLSKRALADERTGRFWENEGLDFNREYLGNAAPAAADWDGDGRTDLLVGNYTGLVYFFRNVSGPGQEPKFDEGTPLYAGGELLRVGGYAAPVVCDYDGDGKKDLVVSDLLGRIHVFLNEGSDESPVLKEGFQVLVKGKPVELGPRAIVDFADLDGDGRKDFIVGNRRGGVYAMLNSGSAGEPVFETVLRVYDSSLVWRRLYDGMQYSKTFKAHYGTFPEPGRAKPMNTFETSCPRACSFSPGGAVRLLFSQRYGRLFVYDELPLKKSG